MLYFWGGEGRQGVGGCNLGRLGRGGAVILGGGSTKARGDAWGSPVHPVPPPIPYWSLWHPQLLSFPLSPSSPPQKKYWGPLSRWEGGGGSRGAPTSSTRPMVLYGAGSPLLSVPPPRYGAEPPLLISVPPPFYGDPPHIQNFPSVNGTPPISHCGGGAPPPTSSLPHTFAPPLQPLLTQPPPPAHFPPPFWGPSPLGKPKAEPAGGG